MQKDNTDWWRPGLVVFARTSAYIAFPIIIALYIGKYLDAKFNTAPYLILLSMVLAFTTSVTLIWRSLKVYMNDLKEFTAKEAGANTDGTDREQK
jgi:F0F1-type ATP synthase assembly protein I